MTKVTVRKRNNKIFEVECDGHTNYGENGEDIVCASLSSVVQTAVLGLLMIVMVEVEMQRDDELGYLKFTLPENLDETQEIQACAILDTMLCGISDLYEGFSDYIELEVKNV
jgi:uncharacterized protein YsxB (DUF464 family)